MTRAAHAPVPLRPPASLGVRIAGTGSFLPEGRLTNDTLASIVDTSDEWIVQRTGIHERRICDLTKGEGATMLCTESLRRALAAASMAATDLDLIICGTISGEMRCPSTACRVAANLGCTATPAFDIGAACSGFVYSLNTAHDLIRAGSYRTVGVIGCEIMSSIMDFTNRGVCILFGDAAGAAVLRATDDHTRGILAQVMRADGSGWRELYLPQADRDVPPAADRSNVRVGGLQMNGPAIFKFAVKTFGDLIEETLQRASLPPEGVDMYVCHQSNLRILEAARERFGIPREKMYINIDRVGNTSAGSVPLCLDELTRAGAIREGMTVMFVAFGAGLTWCSSLWRM